MLNVGEQLVSSYLRYIQRCDFIQTNLPTTKSQGEIDVVGLNISKQQIYICEVAIHLGGLQYTTNDVKNGIKTTRPDNVYRLTNKFSRCIEYACEHWNQYNQHFMLWSPIVKDTKGKLENNQLRHLEEIKGNIKERYGIDIECIVNQKFQECLVELRNYARTETKNIQCPVVRLMQIEGHLEKHVEKLTRVQGHECSSILTHKPDEEVDGLIPVAEVGESEFWAPIRRGEFGKLFAGKPVPIRDEGWIPKDIRTIGVNLHLNNHDCYIQLYFKGADPKERRNKVMTLFPKSDYTYEYKDSPKETKAKFPVLDKGRENRDDWDEIRQELVALGTDIYNKINESDL